MQRDQEVYQEQLDRLVSLDQQDLLVILDDLAILAESGQSAAKVQPVRLVLLVPLVAPEPRVPVECLGHLVLEEEQEEVDFLVPRVHLEQWDRPVQVVLPAMQELQELLDQQDPKDQGVSLGQVERKGLQVWLVQLEEVER